MTKYYHATSFQNSEKIKQTGFVAGWNEMSGPGIYFAKNPNNALSKAHCKPLDAIIVVNLNISRLLTEENSHNNWNLPQLNKLGYDSVQMLHFKTGQEICIYEPQRIKIIAIFRLNHKSNNVDQVFGERIDIPQIRNYKCIFQLL